jgi:hypothetical protein
MYADATVPSVARPWDQPPQSCSSNSGAHALSRSRTESFPADNSIGNVSKGYSTEVQGRRHAGKQITPIKLAGF